MNSNSTQGLVSIIITCYNQSNYIEKAIQSVLNQTYIHWECIIVDDGSTDNSVDAIKTYCDNNNNIKLIVQKNQGVSKARNEGFIKAKGEFIQFLDGDDWLLPKKIEKQILYFNTKADIDVCYVKHNYFFEKNHSLKTFDFETLDKRPFHQFLYKWHAEVAIPPHAFLFKKNIWPKDEVPFPEDYTKREEDWVFHVLTSLKNVQYGYIDEVLCTYFIGKDNFTNSQLNSSLNTIEAAYYIKNLLDENERDHFLHFTLNKAIKKYHESEKANVLRNSINWKIGYFLTLPLGLIYKIYRRYVITK